MTRNEEPRYNIDELARRGGVSRRTIRYYIERGLLAAPTGLGRGSHYTEAHLAALVRIRELQEASVPLDEIAERLLGRPKVPVAKAPLVQSTWTRLELGCGVELSLRGRRLTDEQLTKLTLAIATILGDLET